MVPSWHVTGSGRNKVWEAILSYKNNWSLFEKICNSLKLVEKYDFAKLEASQELKKIKHHKKALSINLHEVVTKDRRNLQFRVFCAVEGQKVIYLTTLYKNGQGSDYNNAIEQSYNIYQSITKGYDKSREQSIEDLGGCPL
jgi:hypothetical protein